MPGLTSASRCLAGFLGVVLLALAASGSTADEFSAPSGSLDLDAIEPGTVATAHTVLSGTEIEGFDVEIVSVIRGVGPDQDMILARGLGETIERLGVAQGMSGSPVYVDGRLIGAVSSTWSFAREPFMGITPVHQMAREAAWGFSRDVATASEATGPPVGSTAGDLAWPGFDGAPGLLAAPSSVGSAARTAPGFEPIGSPLVLSGFDPRVVDLASELFAPWGFTVTSGGGSGAVGEGGALEPGATLGVRLAGGDVNMTAIGTVTWVDEERIHAFGHPLFQMGDVEMPMVTGTIHAIIPSLMISFKLGSGADVVGTLTDDRRSGVFGRLGREPKLTRFDLEVVREGESQHFGYDLVRHPNLGPTLVGLTATNSILSRAGTLAEETVRYEQRVLLDDGRETTVRTLITGESTLGGIAQALAEVTGVILTNPFEEVAIDRIEARLTYEAGTRLAFLTEVAIDDESPEPGDTIRGRYTIRDWRGRESRHEFAIPLPADAREGRYLLLVADANTARQYEAERDPRSFTPRSLDEYLERLGALRQPDDIHIHLYRSSPGVLIDGRPLPDLPPSVIAVMRGTSRSGVQEDLPAEIVHEARIPAGRFIQGGHSLLLEVRKEKP